MISHKKGERELPRNRIQSTCKSWLCQSQHRKNALNSIFRNSLVPHFLPWNPWYVCTKWALRRCAQLTHASFKFPESPCSCDLPSKKRPIRDSLSALKPPQYTTGRLDGSESICCHVSRAPRLLAWELLWSMCVFTICNTDRFWLRVLKHIGGGELERLLQMIFSFAFWNVTQNTLNSNHIQLRCWWFWSINSWWLTIQTFWVHSSSSQCLGFTAQDWGSKHWGNCTSCKEIKSKI
jgi:hypothetical protein